MALGLTPREQEEQVLALLLREAREQGLAPRPVLFARLALYFLSARRAIDRPWVSMVNALTEAVRTGQLVVVDLPNGPWYQPPDLSRIRYSRSEARKVPLFAQWRESATILKGSQHAERLWAAAFELGGWVVPQPHSVRIPCPLPDDPERDHKQSHEIDVFATKGGNVVALEVKNGWSDGWIDPDIVADWKLTGDMRTVRHHFRAMAAVDYIPMLASPFVDNSFFRFQMQHNGFHAKYLYTVFAPEFDDLAKEIRAVFKIGHVWAKPEPPNNFVKTVERLTKWVAP